MLSPLRFILNQVRYYRNNSTPQSWKEDGVKYGLVTYYPRNKNHKDPPIEPTKLLLVTRVKNFKGNPYWDKQILKGLHLDKEKNEKQIAIVKNTPEMCARLWQIKHLIQVRPLKIPDNLPEDINSISTYVHESGQLMVFPKIDEKRYKATEEFINNPKKLDTETVREKLRLAWLNAMT